MATAMTPLSQAAIIDTNVFVYALYPASPHYHAAFHLREQAQDPTAAFYVTAQILAEFYATVTNPRRVDPPLSVEQALREVNNIQALDGLTILPIPVEVVTRWIELARQHQIRRSDIFDTQIVATMLENAIRRIYTFNVDDFVRYTGIEVVMPLAPRRL
jgi:predicted nucleic acid-binding protein